MREQHLGQNLQDHVITYLILLWEEYRLVTSLIYLILPSEKVLFLYKPVHVQKARVGILSVKRRGEILFCLTKVTLLDS